MFLAWQPPLQMGFRGDGGRPSGATLAAGRPVQRATAGRLVDLVF